MKNYRVVVSEAGGNDERTVYEGGSFLASQRIVDAVRTALVIGRGTADISQFVDRTPGPVIRVREGSWS